MSGRELPSSSQDDAVLVVYVEPLLRDRRVLFVGDAGGEALERVARVASRVIAFDTSRNPRRRRLPNGLVEPFDPYEVEALDSTFDVVVVPDVMVIAETAEERFDDFARLVGRRGFVVAGLSSEPPAPEHEELWDLLAARFDHVRMAGAAPIRAVAVAELSQDDVTGVVVDGSLVSEPARLRGFVAVAGQTEPSIDGYLMVQVDDAPTKTVAQPVADPRLVARLRDLEAELVTVAETLEAQKASAARHRAERDEAREERKRFDRELREARDAEAKLRRALAQAEENARSGPSAEEFADLEENLAAQVERVRDLEAEVERRGRLVRELVEETRERRGGGDVVDSAELAAAVERAVRAEAEKQEAWFRNDELRARLADHTDAGVEALRSRDAELSGAVRGYRARIAEAEQRLAQAEARLAGTASDLEVTRVLERETSARIGQLVGQLMLSREREVEARNARDVARGENLALVAQVAALETQHRELRDGLLVRLDRLVRSPAPSDSVDTAVTAVEALLESLRGEVSGLRMRADALERSAAGVGATDAAPSPVVDSRLAREVESLRLENEALAADLADAKARARETGDGELAAREALVARLQLELADSERRALAAEERERTLAGEAQRLRDAVVDAAGAVEERDVLARRIAGLENDLRDAVAAAARAADDARTSAMRATTAESRSVDAEREASQARAALEETRAILDELERAAAAGRGPGASIRADVAADLGDDRGRGDEGETALLLRSLTEQLEERDDRIRALERRLSGSVAPPPGDAEALGPEMLNLQETVARLQDALGVEREARRLAEERANSSFGTAGTAAHRELERRLEAQQRDLEEAQVRIEGVDRDVRTLRSVFAETRAGLENLLGASSGAGDPAIAERIGELLTLLGRY